jgi:hypothetical protein
MVDSKAGELAAWRKEGGWEGRSVEAPARERRRHALNLRRWPKSARSFAIEGLDPSVCCVFYIQCRCVVSALLERRSCHLILRGGTEELTSFLINLNDCLNS